MGIFSMKRKSFKGLALLAIVGLGSIVTLASAETTTHGRYGKDLAIDLTNRPTEGEQYTSIGRIVRVREVADSSQYSWNNDGQKVYNFTAEAGFQLPESIDFLGNYNYEGHIFVNGVEYRYWSLKHYHY
jgi:hypothetical protein